MASVLTMLHSHNHVDSATDNTEQNSVHQTHIRELQAPRAYEERIISIIIITLYGQRNHQDLSQSRTLSIADGTLTFYSTW